MESIKEIQNEDFKDDCYVYDGLLFAAGVFSESAARIVYVKKKPPVYKVVVVKPSKPQKAAVWKTGHWKCKKGNYVWIKGSWVDPKPGFVWIDGHWKKTKHGWLWVKDHWRTK